MARMRKSNCNSGIFLTVHKLSWGGLFSSILLPVMVANAQTQAEVIQAGSLPAVTVSEDVSTTESPAPLADPCQGFLVSQDIENRYQAIQEQLEGDYQKGLPHQLKNEFMAVRAEIDRFAGQLFDVDLANSLEVNHIVQQTIDHLDKMISLIPKANQMAPQMRDRYVIPFTNISSIKAEHQECLMKAAIKEVRDRPDDHTEDGPSINIYRRLTDEMERMNTNLYNLQTTDVHTFVSLRADLMKRLENYNKVNSKTNATILTADIPKIINRVHRDIEKVIPGLELSKKYLTLAQ